MKRKPQPSASLRIEIARTAARLLADGAAVDFDSARRKAARDLGASRELPDRLELQRELATYLMLFRRDEHIARITRLRAAALRAIDLFAPFKARLVGPVLYGTACAPTAVGLHLFSDEFEAVTRFLLERHRPYSLIDKRVCVAGSDAPQRLVCIQLTLFDELFELTIVPVRGPARIVSSEIDGRPIASADRAQVQAMLDTKQIFSSDFELEL